jgi:hypothetical protein
MDAVGALGGSAAKPRSGGIGHDVVDLECGGVDVVKYEVGRAVCVNEGNAGERHSKPTVPIEGGAGDVCSL